MKKLLILMLVLGMASVASAALVLDVTGGASDIGVASDATWYPADNTYTFVVVNTTGGFTLTGGALTPYAPEASNVQSGIIGTVFPEVLPFINAAINTAYGDTVSSDGIMGAIGTSVSTGIPPGLYMDSYVLGGGNAYVYLVHTPNWATYTAIDKQYVPEPATVALLSLGGLALLRKRRA